MLLWAWHSYWGISTDSSSDLDASGYDDSDSEDVVSSENVSVGSKSSSVWHLTAEPGDNKRQLMFW